MKIKESGIKLLYFYFVQKGVILRKTLEKTPIGCQEEISKETFLHSGENEPIRVGDRLFHTEKHRDREEQKSRGASDTNFHSLSSFDSGNRLRRAWNVLDCSIDPQSGS